MKKDITMYSDSELSDLVVNDENLYNELCAGNLTSEDLKEYLIFTPAQESDFEDTIREYAS